MTGADIFDVYRMTLAIVFGSYAVVRTGHVAWHWQAGTRRAGRHEALVRRFVLTSLLRTRVRRFWFALAQIVVLLAVFAYLLGLQAWTRQPAASAPPTAAVGPADAAASNGRVIL
jgi:hypothetical protein